MDARLEFLPLLLILFLAFIVPPLLARFRWLPVVVGEILVGIVVGRSGLNLVHPDATLEFLAEIGLAILMFLSGLEVDFSLMTSRRGPGREGPGPLALGGGAFLLTLGSAALFSQWIMARGLTDDFIIVALILSTTSPGIVLSVLKGCQRIEGALGQTLLLAALLADFGTMVLFTVYVTLKAKGLSLDILLVVLLFVIALVVIRVGRTFLHRRPQDSFLSDVLPGSTRTRLHGSMALLLAFVILAALLGSEMILGAFLAGAVLSLLSGIHQAQLKNDLDAIGFGFFIPVFFLMIGVKFDLSLLAHSRRMWLLAPLLLVGAYLVKIGPALIFRLRFPWKETLAGGVLLASRLSLLIAASGIALRLGAIDESTHAGFILIAAVTATFSPVLFSGLMPAGAADSRRTAIAIYGVNDLALQTARELSRNKEGVLFIESEPGQGDAARECGFPVVSSFAYPPLLGVFKLPPLKSMLVLTPQDDLNAEVCRQANTLGIGHVVVLVNDMSRLSEFTALGAQPFAPGLYRPTLLALMARHPGLFGVMISGRAHHQVREIPILNPEVSGLALKNLALGGDILVLSVRRGAESLIPHGDTKLVTGDWVSVYGDEAPIEALQARLGSR